MQRNLETVSDICHWVTSAIARVQFHDLIESLDLKGGVKGISTFWILEKIYFYLSSIKFSKSILVDIFDKKSSFVVLHFEINYIVLFSFISILLFNYFLLFHLLSQVHETSCLAFVDQISMSDRWCRTELGHDWWDCPCSVKASFIRTDWAPALWYREVARSLAVVIMTFSESTKEQHTETGQNLSSITLIDIIIYWY